jgi:hypothetical protein
MQSCPNICRGWLQDPWRPHIHDTQASDKNGVVLASLAKLATPCFKKQNKKERAGGIAQVVECLLGKSEAQYLKIITTNANSIIKGKV